MIFDDRLVPWVLEANMSPGLSHRNEQHNRLIESMIEGLMKKLLNDPPANINSTSFPCEGGDLGAWEPLDTTTREGTDGESYDKRWRGIPVNIPNSRYHLISGEGKINKTWLDVLRSGSLSATISGTLCEETAVTGGGDDDTVSVSEKSYLRDKFSGLRSSSFLRESNSCEEETRGLVEGRDMEIISAVMGGRGDSVKPAASASIEWSMGLRGDRPRSASAVNAKSRFITTSKKDLLKVVAAANTTSNGDKNPAGMTATESRLHLYNQMNVAFDPSTFVAVGAAISKQALFALDYIIDACDKIYLLQRWARRFIIRLRAYHERRWLACTVIQCMVRQALARVKVMALVRQRAVVAVQTQMRMYLAGLELERRRRRRASALLGSQIYKFVIKNRKRKWLVDGRAKTIQRFLHLCMHRYYNKRAMIIGRQARRWVTVRWRHRRVVRHTIALFYRHRVLAAMTIKRSPLMKLFLKYLQTKRRRRRHLLRLTTAQARKPNKGLRHVVTVNVKMHVVVIDHGDEFSPLFRYNTVTRQDNNGGTVAEGSVPIDPEEAIQNFPLAQKKNSVSSFGINFTPAASKALDLVNSMLEASEISQKNKRDQEVMDALMNRSERARQFTATGEARAGDVFDILDFVCKHADGDASREDRPLPPPLPKKSISFSLGKIGASPSPVFNSRDCMDNFAVGFASAVTPAQDRLATASISSPDEQSDENGNEQSGEEERLFQNGQLRMYSASDLPMNRHLVTSKPPAEMQLTLDGFDDVSDTEKLGNGEEESMELDLIKEIHHMHQKHSEPIRHRLCNQELDQPRIRQEYEMPPRLSLMHPPQRDEDLEYVDHPPDSPGLSDEMDSEDDFMQEQERRIQMGRAPKPKKRAVAKKSKSAKSLRGPVKPPPRDPDEIYREQLERQLSEAKAKYAQKQMKRQADAYYRQSDIIRGESTPFDTRVRPQEVKTDLSVY